MARSKNDVALARRARALARAERTFLCRPTERDGTELKRLRKTSWPFLEPWEPAPEKGRSPWGDAWWRGFLASSRRKDVERLLLCRDEDGALLGQIGISNIVRGAFHSAYVGYWIGAEHARLGYMTEGLRAAVRHAFEGLDLHRVEANLIPENTASKRLAQRCGFRLEGFSPRYLRIAGRWSDHERWALTREDWEADRASSQGP